MTEFLTSRSRAETTLMCGRARYWLHEWRSQGLDQIKLAIPLVTGGSVHLGLATMLEAWSDTDSPHDRLIDTAVSMALEDYDERCEGRGLQVAELEDTSFVYQEQRALTEALVRLAGLRIIPRLLEVYEVLEVERMDKALLYTSPTISVQAHDPAKYGAQADVASRLIRHAIGCPEPWSIAWRSIPDALLRNRETHELFLLSWKTIGEYGPRVDEAARVDMQGVSEMWALQTRLQAWASVGTGRPWLPADTVDYGKIPQWFCDHMQQGWPIQIRGVQMVYLVKGPRRKGSKELQGTVAAGAANPQVEVWKTASPLIWGYMDKSFPPRMAWSGDWRCSTVHPMRRSQWYPSGECPGDGRLHKRGDDWTSFPVWHGMGVKSWIQDLHDGKITPEAGDPLESSWAMPVPYFRPQAQVDSWLRQTRAQEQRVVEALLRIRMAEGSVTLQEDLSMLNKPETPHAAARAREYLGELLDEHFPQATRNCKDWFHRDCPALALCWGPEHIRQAPLESGLYQIKEAYQEKETVDVG